MTSRFALLAMVVVTAAPLAAQGGGGGMGGGRMGGRGMNADALTAQYDLSADQKTKTEALLKIFSDGTASTQAWMMAQRQAGETRNADSAKKVGEAMAKFNADFKALLAGPQLAKFDSVQAARAARMQGRGPGGGQ
ncbi:MAG: hypothetical protein ACRELE_03045 [Gemmatimonadales bacterium]